MSAEQVLRKLIRTSQCRLVRPSASLVDHDGACPEFGVNGLYVSVTGPEADLLDRLFAQEQRQNRP